MVNNLARFWNKKNSYLFSKYETIPAYIIMK